MVNFNKLIPFILKGDCRYHGIEDTSMGIIQYIIAPSYYYCIGKVKYNYFYLTILRDWTTMPSLTNPNSDNFALFPTIEAIKQNLKVLISTEEDDQTW